jgi:hypothetical protein
MIDLLLQTIGINKIFNGVSTLAMQIGGRYMAAEIPSNVEKIFNRPFFRRLFIFFISFIAFRDIKIAILVTLIFIILFNYLLDEKSKIYLGKIFSLNTNLDKSNKQTELSPITASDLENAQLIIRRYNQNLENKKINIQNLK